MEMFAGERSVGKRFERPLCRDGRYWRHCVSVRSGSITATGNISFRKRLLAIYLITADLKVLSGRKTGRYTGTVQRQLGFAARDKKGV